MDGWLDGWMDGWMDGKQMIEHMASKSVFIPALVIIIGVSDNYWLKCTKYICFCPTYLSHKSLLHSLKHNHSHSHPACHSKHHHADTVPQHIHLSLLKREKT